MFLILLELSNYSTISAFTILIISYVENQIFSHVCGVHRFFPLLNAVFFFNLEIKTETISGGIHSLSVELVHFNFLTLK